MMKYELQGSFSDDDKVGLGFDGEEEHLGYSGAKNQHEGGEKWDEDGSRLVPVGGAAHAAIGPTGKGFRHAHGCL